LAVAVDCIVRLPEPEVVIGLVVEVMKASFPSLAMNIEVPLEVLVNPAPALKVITVAVTSRESPVKVELFVRVALKVIAPVDLIVRGFAELLVTVFPKVTDCPEENDAGPAEALIWITADVVRPEEED
jgi:hypothetical protein